MAVLYPVNSYKSSYPNSNSNNCSGSYNKSYDHVKGTDAQTRNALTERTPAESRYNFLDREEKENSNDYVKQLQQQAQSIANAFDRKNQRNLYDATSDLMAIASIEQIPSLRSMHTRLLGQMQNIKGSGAEESEIRSAVTKIKKVIAKLKAKIKNLQKEEQLERKADNAKKAKRRKLEEEIRRELAVRRKVRKDREQKDVEESRMGMGANYGGPVSGTPVSLQYQDNDMLFIDDAMIDAAMEAEGLAMDTETAVAAVASDAGAAVADVGGSVDIAL